MTQPIHQFIADCEKLLALRGKPSPVFVGGQLYSDAATVKTPGLLIAKGEGLELEIAVTYLREDGTAGNNPVIMRGKDGNIYRTHGEWSYGRKRVQRLLAGEDPDSPIRLGKGDNDWTTGLD